MQVPDKSLAIAIRAGLMRLGAKKYRLQFRALEIFRDEMLYAMENGSDKLIGKLKAKGHYPYSDLTRESVLS